MHCAVIYSGKIPGAIRTAVGIVTEVMNPVDNWGLPTGQLSQSSRGQPPLVQCRTEGVRRSLIIRYGTEIADAESLSSSVFVNRGK